MSAGGTTLSLGVRNERGGKTHRMGNVGGVVGFVVVVAIAGGVAFVVVVGGGSLVLVLVGGGSLVLVAGAVAIEGAVAIVVGVGVISY